MRVPVLPIGFLVLAAAAGVAPQNSHADNGGTGGTGGTGTEANKLAASDFVWEFFYRDDDKEDWQSIRDSDLGLFFNRARCECNTPFKVRITLIQSARVKVAGISMGSIRLGTGSDSCACTNESSCQAMKCTPLGGQQDLGALANGALEFETTIGTLFTAGETDIANACTRRETENIYILPDGADSGSFTDLTDASKEVVVDGQGPPAPGLKASDVKSGNEALQISWTPVPITSADDLEGYAVFCARGGSLAPFANDKGETPFTTRHTSKDRLCGATKQALVSETDLITAGLVTIPEKPPTPESTAPPPALKSLDPAFQCSDFLTSTSSARITGLENHVPYVVGVAAVDKRGNASPIETAVVAYPFPTRDFFRTYRAAGGDADGGFCSLSAGGAPAAAGWWPLLLAGILMGLLRRRRR